MPPCHLIRPKTNLMVAFLLIDIIGMSVHHSHFSACHSLRSVIKTKATEFIRHRRNFRPTEKFDRTFCSHGTVQYFRAVHTEPTNQVDFIFFCQRFYHLPMRRALLQQIQTSVSQPSYHASMQPRLCYTKFQTVMAFTPGRSKFQYNIQTVMVFTLRRLNFRACRLKI